MNGRLALPLTVTSSPGSRRLGGARIYAILGPLAIVLVVVFLHAVNLPAVVERLRHLSIGFAVLCGGAFLMAYVVRALRWRLFLTGYAVGALRVIAIYQVATFINFLLPVRGGELVKCLLLRRLNSIPVSDSLPTVAMDKTMDLLPAAVLLLVLPFLPFTLSRPLWLLLLTVLIVFCCGMGFLGLAAWRRPLALSVLDRIASALPAPFRLRVEPFTMRFVDVLLRLVAMPRLLLIAAGYTAVAVLFDALFCLLAFAAVGVHIAFPLVLFGYTFYNLAFILPTPPGQIGSNELVGLLIFSGIARVNSADVAAMFLFSHPWTALLMAGSAMLCASALGVGIRSAAALTKQPPNPDAVLANTSVPVPMSPDPMSPDPMSPDMVEPQVSSAGTSLTAVQPQQPSSAYAHSTSVLLLLQRLGFASLPFVTGWNRIFVLPDAFALTGGNGNGAGHSGTEDTGAHSLLDAAGKWTRGGYQIRFQDPYLVQAVRREPITLSVPVVAALALFAAATTILLVLERRRGWQIVTIARGPGGNVLTHRYRARRLPR